MNDAMCKKVLAAAMVLAMIGLVLGNGTLSIGQEAKAKKAKGRLPAYFADIVTEEQRTAIYKIQEGYKKQLDDLQAQLTALREKEMAEIEGVLDAEQKAKLEKARADAAGKRKKKSSEANAAEAAPKAAATTKAKAS
jgi:hypothetical protein